MTKAELIDEVYLKSGLPSKAKAEAAINATFECLRNSLATGDGIVITGFGKFTITEHAPRKGRNPRTGEEVIIPATKRIKFSPAKLLKDAVQQLDTGNAKD